MNIPITSRVKRAGKKGCGCGCDCKCGKSPAQFNAGLRKAYKEGKLNPGLEAAMEAKDPQTPNKMWGPAKRKYGAKAVAKKNCGMKY
mgnify:CR=1 FL=1